jgi:hypothetical protein
MDYLSFAAANGSLSIRTLQSLTRSKIHELEKPRNTYETRKAETLATASKCPTL